MPELRSHMNAPQNRSSHARRLAVMPREAIFVAMDDSEASQRLLPALAARARENETVRLVLCHVVLPLPPALLETRGAEDPREEEKIERRQRSAQAQWIAERAIKAKQLMAESKKALVQRGVAAARIDVKVTEPLHSHEKLPDAIIDEAKVLGCGTIAVGRHTFPALREILHTHLSDEIERRADGLDVWIIE